MTEKIYVQINNEKREATPEEIAQIEKDKKEEAERLLLIDAEMQAKQAKLDSAKEKLAALGLDEEEIAAIVGGI